MYTILVVEDSKPIIRNIVNNIESIDSCFKVIDTAYNGEDALKKLKIQDFDILFTDIKMPMMDGLTLIESARKLKPNLKCVIISGYDDFEYAHQAIKLKIDEYILKPINPVELKDVLARIGNDIDRLRDNNIERIFYNALVCNIHPKNEELLEFQNKSFKIALMRTGISKDGPQILDRNIIQQYLKNIYESDYWITDTKYISEKAIVFRVVENQRTDDETNLKLLNMLKKNYPQINIIFSKTLVDTSNLYSLYNELSNAIDNQIVIGKSQILNINKILTKTTLNGLLENLEKEYSFLISLNQYKNLNKELAESLKEWEQKDYPAIVIQKFLVIIINRYFKFFGDTIKGSFLDIDMAVEQILYPCKSYSDLTHNVLDYFNLLHNEIDEITQGSTKELFKKIDTFMKSNIYGNITMQHLSSRFKVTPSYINRIIHANCNASPMNYYMELKIEEAKRLLMSDHNILIKEISDSLGFNDQYYFSKVFKSYTGYSPADFKKLHIK